jgi:hypothetical protein
MQKLNQVVAIEKGVKSRVYAMTSELYKAEQKPDFFTGFTKNFQKTNEDGEDFPPENKRVQFRVDEMLAQVSKGLTELFDVVATKDWANCNARADVVVGDTVIVKNAPATYLLFLEKQLNDVRSIIEKLPTLDEAEDWRKDDNTGLYKTGNIATHKTKKVQKPIVLYDATKEHPAQTQLISDDVIIGHWQTVKLSGAIPAPEKQQLLERVDELGKAVKFARETANQSDAEAINAGKAIFEYLLN